MALVLASKSPRRRQLMALITPDFLVDEAAVDESATVAESPAALALALGRQKAANVAARRAHDVVIGCDTVVEVNGLVLGKPAGLEEAAWMLGELSGNSHLVHTGVCVCPPGGPPLCFCETTRLVFSTIPPGEIAQYIQTPEPYDKAGGYGVQGWAARYTQRVEGCYYNVMGLPVAALYQKLRDAGLLP